MSHPLFDANPHGHVFPKLVSQQMTKESADGEGNYVASCNNCGATATISPSAPDATGLLRRQVIAMEPALHKKCPGKTDDQN